MSVEVSEALRLPLSEDLSGFIALLRRLRVPCRVSEEGDQQVLRVPVEVVEQVRDLYSRHPHGDDSVVIEQPRRRGGFVAALRASPLTAAVLVITLVVAAITMLGENFATIRWLNFVDFRVDGEYAYFASLEQTLATGQWWRLITPIFVHFGILHLAMNSMWFWVWLVVCLSGVIEVLSFGALAIANAAHVGGLVAGCVTGVIGGTLARRRRQR